MFTLGPFTEKVADPRMPYLCPQANWHHFWPGLHSPFPIWTLSNSPGSSTLTRSCWLLLSLGGSRETPGFVLSRSLHGAASNLDCASLYWTGPRPSHPCTSIRIYPASSALAQETLKCAFKSPATLSLHTFHCLNCFSSKCDCRFWISLTVTFLNEVSLLHHVVLETFFCNCVIFFVTFLFYRFIESLINIWDTHNKTCRQALLCLTRTYTEHMMSEKL